MNGIPHGDQFGRRGWLVGKALDAWYCVPPERDEPIVQVALAGCGPVCIEVRVNSGRLVLELFSRPDGLTWVLPADELQEILRLAEDRLGVKPELPANPTTH